MNLKIVFPLLAAVCASAQPACPPINFLNAKTINLSPTGSSHMVLLRQDDGSYTAFEVANTSPYGVLRTIPHFERQFSNCLPRQTSKVSSKASRPGLNTQNAVAQPAAFAILDSGNYLFVSTNGGNSLDVAVFDRHLQPISENQAGTLPFGQPPPEGTGRYLSLVLTDVNGDGKLDLVAQYEFVKQGKAFGGGGVSVLIGDDAGGFQAAGGFPLSGTVNGSMAVGDLNGDGQPDIAVGVPPLLFQQGAGNIVLALGKGDGTFVPALLPTPNLIAPGAIAISDLNGDKKNDLIFLTCPLAAGLPFTPDEVGVMLGNGDGTFSPPAVFPVQVAAPDSVLDDRSSAPGAIAVGDVNGDGIPDIVTNGISVLLGDGKGGFPNRRDFLNMAGESVILTDFDGDGKMDVVIGIGNPMVLSQVQQFTGFKEDTLSVFFGDGAGGLAAAPLAPSPAQTSSSAISSNGADNVVMASGDFNQDGIADLAVVREFQYLAVFLASAGGALTPVFTYDFAALDKEASPTSVVAGDFNHDGKLDLAVTVARSSAPSSILVFLGLGDGTFLPPVSSGAPASIASPVVGDFNQDGRLDLAAIDTTVSLDTDRVLVFLGQGDGTFATPQTYPAGMLASSLAAGDFNHDGINDIAIGNFTGISLLAGKADGTFSPGVDILFPHGMSPGPLAAADLNGDGKLDLVAGAAILLGHGDGTFDPPTIYPSGPAFGPGVDSVLVGDINGDGIPDVFLSTGNILIGNGDGTFQLQTTGLPGPFSHVIAADFNGDGKLDIAGGFVMYGKGLITEGQAFRRGAAIFLNFSHPAALLNVVSAADFSYGPMAPHSIASAFGKHLASSTAAAAPPSLPTALGGASVSIQDQTGAVSQAEIYYASAEQVNFVLPPGLEAGTAIVTIKTTDGQSADTQIQIADPAPKIFIVDPSGIPAGYAVRIGSDNVQTIEPIFSGGSGHVQQVPIDLSTGAVYLVLFGTGFDAPLNASAKIDSQKVTVTYAGPQAQFPGLDQVNILLPKSLAGSGLSSLDFSALIGPEQANRVYITIK